MLGYLQILVARLMATRGEDPFLYPQIDQEHGFFGPGWADSPCSTEEDAIKLAKEKARMIDGGRGRTFIQDSAHPAYKANGPWGFSREAHARHGVEFEE